MSSKAAPPQRWFASWRFARPAPSVDPADYGTAFGLEMSLEDEAAAAPPAPVERRPGWVRRLARRRPSAV